MSTEDRKQANLECDLNFAFAHLLAAALVAAMHYFSVPTYVIAATLVGSAAVSVLRAYVHWHKN